MSGKWNNLENNKKCLVSGMIVNLLVKESLALWFNDIYLHL